MQAIFSAPTQHNVTFLVLCGGAGTRVEGKDKPLLGWQGVPMVDNVLASVPTELPKLISANRNLNAYAKRGEVVTDSTLPGRGPLVGILAGLSACTTAWLLVAPGDTPALPAGWWQHMIAAVNEETPNVVAHDASRQQNLHLLLHVESVRDNLNSFLQQNRHQVHLWLDTISHSNAVFDQTFNNINRLDQIAAF